MYAGDVITVSHIELLRMHKVQGLPFMALRL